MDSVRDLWAIASTVQRWSSERLLNYTSCYTVLKVVSLGYPRRDNSRMERAYRDWVSQSLDLSRRIGSQITGLTMKC